MKLSFIFSSKNEYEGMKKYRVFSIFNLKFRFRISMFKTLRRSRPKLLNNLRDYDNILKNKNEQRQKCELAICAIYKNEPDIKEWIEYHRLIGIDRFYLYDNDSDDNSREILKPYIENGIVVYKYVSGRCMQVPVYRDAVFRYKNETKWLAIIDLDEYIVPVSTNNLKDFLKEYDKYPAVGVNWLMFDSNGLVKRPNKPVIEAYTRCDYNFPSNKMIKSIVKPNKVLSITDPHFCYYRKKLLAVDENFKELKPDSNGGNYSVNTEMPMNKIRINHYHTKSQEDWERKMGIGFADSTKIREHSPGHLVFDRYDSDDTILKYLPQLKKNMNMEMEIKK